MSIVLNCHFDPSRVPEEGQAAITIWRFGPYEFAEGGVDAWDDNKERIMEENLRKLQFFAPNLTDDKLIGKMIDTPVDMIKYNPTFQRGDVGGVAKFFYQQGGHRPTPELSQYAVPGAQGLYLAGTFMHPPGGVTGGGRATAVKICGDIGIDFDKLIG